MRKSLHKAWRHFRKRPNPFVVAAFVGVSLLLESLWILQYPGVLMMQAIDRDRTPAVADKVAVVEIDNGDYETLFKQDIPAHAGKLNELIQHIKKLGAKLVAVDIDTSDGRYGKFYGSQLDPKIIWARGVELDGDTLKPSGFLGQKNLPDSPLAGIAGFERDPDFAVRKLKGCVPLDGHLMRTFHRAAFLAFKDEPDQNICIEQAIPGVRYRFPTLSAGEIENAAKRGNAVGSLLHNKIVVLGGTYSIQDYHPGPNGSMIPGVELVASAIEAQTQERESGKIGEVLIGIAADIFFGFCILWIYATGWHPLAQLLAALVLSLIVLFVPGVLLYRFGFWTLNPFLVAFGMILDQMYEAANAAAELREKSGVHKHASARTA